MGEVYRARDTQLERDVAVKVLAKDFAADAVRLRRFEHEAKVLAGLSHPNILVIHEAGVHEGTAFLVSELLEGRTLRDLMGTGSGASTPSGTGRDTPAVEARAGLGLRKASSFALQIVHGLAAAHAKGVIHRDLKPENIFITRDRRVKLLDFGLAKSTQAPTATPGAGAAASVLTTEPGAVMGTPGYMAPEQVRGASADPRSDIFAFGAVLYEMLTGQRAFRRDSAIETMNAILSSEPPDIAETAPNVPAPLERVVRRCLEKQPEDRFQTAHDLAFALESAAVTDTSSIQRAVAARGVPPRWRVVLPWGLAAAGVLVGAAGWWRATPSRSGRDSGNSAHPQVRKVELTMPAALRKDASREVTALTISPDGRMLAHATGEGLWVRWLDRTAPPALVRQAERIAAPAWSPDGTELAFFEAQQLYRMAVAGGPPRLLCTAAEFVSPQAGCAWFTDDRILYTTSNSGVYEVPAVGGEPRLVLPVKPGESDFHELSPLPGGGGVLLVVHREPEGADTISVWSRMGQRKDLLQIRSDYFNRPVFSASGHVLFERTYESPDLWAFPFSLARLERTGEPFLVAANTRLGSVAADGTLVSSQHSIPGVFDFRRLVWVGRTGQITGPIGRPRRGLTMPRLSPDERRIAVIAGPSFPERNVWVLEAAQGAAAPLTRGTNHAFRPFWLPDGQRVAFSHLRGPLTSGTNSMVIVSVDAIGGGERVFDGVGAELSRSGKYLLTMPSNPGASRREYLRLEGTNRVRVPFPEGLDAVFAPALSPDDTLLAYESNESGQSEVYVVAFPAFTNRVMVSRGGGVRPQWRHDGSELFYLDRRVRSLMAAACVEGAGSAGAVFREPVALFDLPPSVAASYTDRSGRFDSSADGQRFLMVQAVVDEAGAPYEPKSSVWLTEHWFEEFRPRR
jgi:tRNA A-37 threonylcarbamoyl transferase component Bud32